MKRGIWAVFSLKNKPRAAICIDCLVGCWRWSVMMGFRQVIAGGGCFHRRGGEPFTGTGRGRCSDLQVQNNLSGSEQSPARTGCPCDGCWHAWMQHGNAQTQSGISWHTLCPHWGNVLHHFGDGRACPVSSKRLLEKVWKQHIRIIEVSWGVR